MSTSSGHGPPATGSMSQASQGSEVQLPADPIDRPRRKGRPSRKLSGLKRPTSTNLTADADTGKRRWRVAKEFSLLRRYGELSDSDETKYLVDRMREYFEEYQSATPDGYWHRKSGQVVLAVLLLRHEGKLKHVRGINSEVSLPSGSICAERAAIAAAMSQYLSVSRSDFVAVAVLAPQAGGHNPIRPCGVCGEWIKKIEEASPTFTVVTFTSHRMDEILEHCPVTFVEEIMDEVPEHLRGNWTCKCGFQLNKAKQAYCSCCKQPRFRFRQHLQKHRFKVLTAIASLRYSKDNSPRVCRNATELMSGVLSDTASAQSDDESLTDMRIERNTDGLRGVPLVSLKRLSPATAIRPRLRRRRVRTGDDMLRSCFVASISRTCDYSLEVTAKTIRDLYSLKFIARREYGRADSDGDEYGPVKCQRGLPYRSVDCIQVQYPLLCRCCRFHLTRLGEEFLSASTTQHNLDSCSRA